MPHPPSDRCLTVADKVCVFYFKETSMVFTGGFFLALSIEACNLHNRIALLTTMKVVALRFGGARAVGEVVVVFVDRLQSEEVVDGHHVGDVSAVDVADQHSVLCDDVPDCQGHSRGIGDG